jgi:arginyl-tRNA synthetase
MPNERGTKTKMSVIIFRIRRTIQDAIKTAIRQGKKDGFFLMETPEEVTIETPKDRLHGNFATNAALVAAKYAKRSPLEVAKELVSRLGEIPYLSRTEIAGPGFINFYLDQEWLGDVAAEVLSMKERYGSSSIFDGERIQIEFVSANPVGPMNVVNARAGAVGDSLGRLFTMCGAEVQREYYVNDFGVQVWTLGRSIEARYRELLGEEVKFPEEGYQGDYITDLAQAILEEQGADFRNLPDEDRIEYCKEFGYQKILRSQKTDLAAYGINYDIWFSERSLHENGDVDKTFTYLNEQDLLYEAEGAVWFKTSLFGDDKDRVIRTADGRTTYFISDITYHINKFNRGFTRVIDIWGPDHHGYIPRMKAAMAAVNIQPERLEVLIAQQINLLKGGVPFKMSKRRGEFITMEDLLNEVGNDAARWYFLMRSTDSHLDFDLELAKSQSSDNPVFYVQYAHARICSIFRQTQETGFSWEGWRQQDLNCWEDDEKEMVEMIARFPEVISSAAIDRGPHRITTYLLELATLFHAYYNRKRFLVEDKVLTHSRLSIAAIVRVVIAKGLDLLGISAPERM